MRSPGTCGMWCGNRKNNMHLRQTAIYFIANVFSAAFGLLNVVIFTRLFSPHEYGVYVLGFGFAVTLSTFLSSWLKLLLLREQAKGDGTDVRGTVLLGFLLSCLVAPIAYPAARLAGLEADAAGIAVLLAIVLGFFETCVELWRAQLQAFTLLKATMLRAVLVPILRSRSSQLVRPVFCCSHPRRAPMPWLRWCLREAGGGQSSASTASSSRGILKAGLPLTFSLTLYAISNVIDRFVVAHLGGEAAAGQYAVGVDLVRQTLIIPAISAAAAFVPLAVQILANQERSSRRSISGIRSEPPAGDHACPRASGSRLSPRTSQTSCSGLNSGKPPPRSCRSCLSRSFSRS